MSDAAEEIVVPAVMSLYFWAEKAAPEGLEAIRPGARKTQAVNDPYPYPKLNHPGISCDFPFPILEAVEHFPTNLAAPLINFPPVSHAR